MWFSIGEATRAEAAGNPLRFGPRFDITGPRVTVADYSDAAGRERLIGETFGSMRWLWAENDDIRFDPATRQLEGVAFAVTGESAPTPTCRPAPEWPLPMPSGLRTEAAESFTVRQATVFCCTPKATELRCFLDEGGLDTPPEIRIAIAQDLTLLIRDGALAGWSLTDPARYLTSRHAEPNPALPAPATRSRLAECLALISSPLVDDVMDQEPEALQRLRQTERALRDQHEDRHRAQVLHEVVGRLIEDYAS